MNAQVSLLKGSYNLIYFPHELYPYLVQPIIRTLIPQTQDLHIASHAPEHELDGLTPDQQHRFLNISITPIECSLVVHASWARAVFLPAIARLPAPLAAQVRVSADTYMILCVIAAGLDPAGRVMQLSSPLALAGIPIFFLTTYYADFILAPTRERARVVDALGASGFDCLEDGRFFNHAAYKRGHVRFAAPGAPPEVVAELRRRTFELLKKRQVAPFVDPSLELLLAGGRDVAQLPGAFANYYGLPPSRRGSGSGSGGGGGSPTTTDGRRRGAVWADGVDPRLFNCIVSALVSQPRFLSVTLAEDDPPSVLMDRHLLPLFGDSVVGDFNTTLVPIFLNLENLPSEVTGVVSGVAGTLVQEMKVCNMLEMSYLSTARASAVVLPQEQAERALAILDKCMEMAELVP
ncbi:hypothetical protein ISF_01334 [Cordyceps fumosorosea ARSEF 2679]|uniref:CASTOR ACT domain-containing protein n=1 Tax=Cordyceps fumosorosea (strain ARSEF 2679) TaxID=1081104 RepID=A0A168D7P0_CORFA|nr:hypothetical protein ISF_01334 [Cordyceps fumosorosea ARSEF 2679]OAA72261.1 hypothetical protein ISF_01334 [Cordyceps fumosorosea ARSEF 2679]